MIKIRHLSALCVLLLVVAPPPAALAAAAATDGLTATRELAQAGALHLALRRIDLLQAKDAAAPGWVEWERLRLQLLLQLDRHQELLQRAAALPFPVPSPTHAELHGMAARAALLAGQAAAAREQAARALWSGAADPARLRELRLLVIRSQALESRGEEAYRSMLRFEQDYRPLDAATATVFVDLLLDAAMPREAVHWLGVLDERGATKLRLRLHTAVVTPQDAMAQARAAITRSEDPVWWRVILEAAERQNNGAQRIAAMEQLLDQDRAADGDAGRLWQAAADHARAAANAHQLLAGDEGSWLDFAVRRREADAPEARAYFAYLARHARDPAVQQNAQIQLAAGYAAAKLPRAALRMFAAWPGDPEKLAVPTRQILGSLAEGRADFPQALRYWQGIPAPEHTPPAVWSLQLAALALRAGNTPAAVEAARQLAAGNAVIPAAQLPAWMVLAQQLADHAQYDAALALYERILPHADAARARELLSGIARLHEARREPLLAADYYLRSALRAPKEVPLGGAPKEVPLGGAAEPDAAAITARMQAAFSLARAGLREDARAQFEWLLKNARDPAQISTARRELGF